MGPLCGSIKSRQRDDRKQGKRDGSNSICNYFQFNSSQIFFKQKCQKLPAYPKHMKLISLVFGLLDEQNKSFKDRKLWQPIFTRFQIIIKSSNQQISLRSNVFRDMSIRDDSLTENWFKNIFFKTYPLNSGCFNQQMLFQSSYNRAFCQRGHLLQHHGCGLHD